MKTASRGLSSGILAAASQPLALTVQGAGDEMAEYAMSALCDPYVLTAKRRPAELHLSFGEAPRFAGMTLSEPCRGQKERIVFAGAAGERVLLNPNEYRRLAVSKAWTPLASIAELPGVVARPGTAVFAFNPLALIRSYLNMAEPEITGDIVSLIAAAALCARGDARTIRHHDLRRDFHSYGVAAMLVAKLAVLRGGTFDVAQAVEEAAPAARAYCAGRYAQATKLLAASLASLARVRSALAPLPVYILHMPHGGILFRDEGYAEYDWPEASAKVLNLYLRWAKDFGYRFAPDLGAGTLEHLNSTHPQTVRDLADAWKNGLMEFVNGTWGQPYLQIWRTWDQRQHFSVGLAAFERVFHRRPTVYAAQEMALHPNLPGLLVDFGYKYAIHRVQNLGVTPDCTEALIRWQGADGRSILTLPSHPSKSEKHGSLIFRDWPDLVSRTLDDGLPFAAITSLIDQTFVGPCQEEFIRANRYAAVFGEFMTPSGFFAATPHIASPDRYFTLDDHTCELALPEDSYHRYEMTASSSLHAYWNAEAARLEDAERRGKLDPGALGRLLDGEAHDAYILPYFKQGAFLDLYLTEYPGPRYRVTGDNPRGVARYIKDSVGLPDVIEDRPATKPSAARVRQNRIAAEGRTVAVDARSGAVSALDGAAVRFGEVRYQGRRLARVRLARGENRLLVRGELPGIGSIEVEYFIAGGFLYGVVSLPGGMKRVPCDVPYWEDGVCLAHEIGKRASVVRHSSGVEEATHLEQFFSVDRLAVEWSGGVRRFRHGGNIFFRRCGAELLNRLWAYEERSRSFWWAVELRKDKP